ncbi:MAG: cupin domain-containing protein [Acidobacteriota bacterium]
MIQEEAGWFVVNVKDAKWRSSDTFCKGANFEVDGRFPDVGINLMVLSPGKPNCRYHRENAQEDFLVLSGRCTLLVNDEEKELGPWDFVHCPPGVSHVFVGAGTGPCALLAIGHRRGEQHRYWYPKSDLARRHGAEVPESTDQIPVAYADVAPPVELVQPEWPLD